jgi:hypothetical protein
MRLFKVVKDSIDVFVIEIARIKIAIQVIRQIENNPHNHIYMPSHGSTLTNKSNTSLDNIAL